MHCIGPNLQVLEHVPVSHAGGELWGYRASRGDSMGQHMHPSMHAPLHMWTKPNGHIVHM